MNRLCQAAGVSRAGYYRFRRRHESKPRVMALRHQIQNIALRPNHDGAGGRLRRYQPDFEKIPQHVGDVIQFLRRSNSGQIEGAQGHAIELPMVLRCVGRQ